MARSSTAAAVGLLALGFLGSWGPTRALADPSEDRLGCGDFCQTAGGYGGAGGNTPHSYAVTVNSGTVTADPDGYVPVPLTCHLSVQCTGVLIVIGPTGSARTDLVVAAGATRTLGVPLGSSLIGYLRSNGPTAMHVTADAGDSRGYVYQPGGLEEINLTELTVVAPG